MKTLISITIFVSIIATIIFFGCGGEKKTPLPVANKDSWSSVLKSKPLEMKETQERFKESLHKLDERSK